MLGAIVRLLFYYRLITAQPYLDVDFNTPSASINGITASSISGDGDTLFAIGDLSASSGELLRVCCIFVQFWLYKISDI